MRAITVCVDYSDILSITLPANIHHFTEFWVVTSLQDTDTHNLVEQFRKDGYPVYLVKTDKFYERGAAFAKWAGLELGLEIMERRGWITVMDADILMPRVFPQWHRELGNLYTPLRRMLTDLRLSIPYDYMTWKRYPLHSQQVEWAGYFQCFHANDPVLGTPPWYDVTWRHAGGADSFFQRKWPQEKKLRPPFEVLHIGEAGVNWCGRTSAFLNGSVPPEAANRTRQLQGFLAQRRQSRATGDPYRHERLES